MDQKPFYFDGSGKFDFTLQNEPNEAFQITEEMRKKIGKNPYFSEKKE
jgi:hypothetical protein